MRRYPDERLQPEPAAESGFPLFVGVAVAAVLIAAVYLIFGGR